MFFFPLTSPTVIAGAIAASGCSGFSKERNYSQMDPNTKCDKVF